jgi:anti-sigma B factor antagonist
MGQSSPPTGFSVLVSQDRTEVVVQARGALDVERAPALRRTLADLIDDGARSVVVDLRETPYLDSVGLGVLVGALKRARDRGGEVSLCGPQKNVYELIDLTGLTEVFVITGR